MLKISLCAATLLTFGVATHASAQSGSWSGAYVGVVAGASSAKPYGYYHGYFYNYGPTPDQSASSPTPSPTPTPTTTPSPSDTPSSTPAPSTTPTTAPAPATVGGLSGGAGSGATTGYISYTLNKQFTDGTVALTGGYNIQRGKWVLGVDGDFGFIGGSGGGTNLDPGGSGRWDKLRIDYGGHARLRFGYDLGQWMPYFGAGAVFDEIYASHYGISPATIQPMVWSQEHMRLGWTVGVGVETHLSQGWNFRAEYLRDYFGKDTNQWVQDVLFSYNSINVDVIRVGLVKHF
jgi:opacity protein-like surface antigen